MTESGVSAADLARGAEEILPAGQLEERLSGERPLRVKLGIDPTAPDIHLGHVVPLTKLRQFQDAGHQVVLIIGDYTARVGDPSGRDTRRPVLTPEQIDANAQTFQDQAFRVLDRDATEVRFNSEWLDMPAEDLFKLVGQTTVARLLERDDFTKRMKADQPISGLELLYPILQGYDSVAVDSDLELGGTDQKFNLLFARDIQRAYEKPEQAVMTLPILPGTDGTERMSKSAGNYIGVTEAPEEMFGKVMSIPDSALETYYRLLLLEDLPGDPPVQAKRALGRRIVDRFHGDGAGEGAEAHFDTVHVARDVPDDVEELDLASIDGIQIDDGLESEIHVPLLLASAFGMSTSEARRLMKQGGVKVDGEPLPADPLDVPLKQLAGKVLQAGKRRFAAIQAPPG